MSELEEERLSLSLLNVQKHSRSTHAGLNNDEVVVDDSFLAGSGVLGRGAGALSSPSLAQKLALENTDF